MALKRVVVVLALFLSLVVERVGIAEESFFNWGSCLRWRITGICRIVCHRGHCHVWVRVRHWRPDEVADAPAAILLTNVFARYGWRYANRGYRYALIDSGHIGENLRLVAHSAGLGDVSPLRTIRGGPADEVALMIGNPGGVGYDTKREEILVPN